MVRSSKRPRSPGVGSSAGDSAIQAGLPGHSRQSGGMALRPNRRVNVRSWQRQSSDKASNRYQHGEADQESGLDEDDEVARDIDEVLEGDFSADYVPKKRRTAAASSEDEHFSILDDNDYDEPPRSTSTGPHHKFGRRKIISSLGVRRLQERAEKTKQKATESPATKIKEMPYEDLKDCVCMLCAKELDQTKLETCPDVFSGKTQQGSSLLNALQIILQQELHPNFVGRRLCQKCFSSLNQVESLYHQYRKAAESLVDTFHLGQKILDSDMCSMDAVQDVPHIASFIDVSNVTLKVVDEANFIAFNALAFDFQIPIDKLYRCRIVSASDLPRPDATSSDGNDGLITLMFDTSTGVLEKADIMSAAETTSETYDLNVPQVYLTCSEFAELSKVMNDGKMYVSQEEFAEKIVKWLLLGYRSRYQIVLSPSLVEEYRKQIPGLHGPYLCSDCHTSYEHFHLLANHVQNTHSPDDDEPSQSVQQHPELIRLGRVKGSTSVIKTLETATLEKPFQCEHCNKCFTEYLTLSAHVDHYHGFHRACNVEGCGETFDSIQTFAQHYVLHADPNFVVPSDFKEKVKIVLPCPMCSISIQGVWKYFTHTYTHDKEPRFKCPVCGKRSHKVQNFKDHLTRHRQCDQKV